MHTQTAFFTVVFYGHREKSRKAMQSHAKGYGLGGLILRAFQRFLQNYEKLCKAAIHNYKSSALPTELKRRMADRILTL